jgi:hypothetical protein
MSVDEDTKTDTALGIGCSVPSQPAGRDFVSVCESLLKIFTTGR